MDKNIKNLFKDNRIKGKTKLRQIQLVQLRLLKNFDYICNKHNLQYWLHFGTLLGAVRHKGFIPWDDDLDVSMLRKDFDKFLEVADKEVPHDIFIQTPETDPDYNYYHIPLKLRDKYSTFIGRKNNKFHQGIFIDVFPFDISPESKFFRYVQFRLYKIFVVSFLRKLNFSIKAFLELRFFRQILVKIIVGIIGVDKIKTLILRMYKLNKKHLYRCSLSSNFNTYFKKEDIFPLKKLSFEDNEFPVPNNYDNYLTKLYGDYMIPTPEKNRKPTHSKYTDPFNPCNHKETLNWGEISRINHH